MHNTCPHCRAVFSVYGLVNNGERVLEGNQGGRMGSANELVEPGNRT